METIMSTLQDRLRSRNGNPAGYGLGPVCDEAADELDRLQAECEHLRSDRDLEKKIRKDYVDALEAMRAENEALRKSGTFAGWFTELRSGMTYRLWEQGGAKWEPGYVALYE